MSISNRLFFLFLFFVGWSSCGEEEVYTPKRRAFPKVVYPERNYSKLDINYCNFTFEYPNYARVEQDTSFFDEKPVNPCWFDLVIPTFDARLH